MNLDELDEVLKPAPTAPVLKLLGPAPQPVLVSGFRPLVFPFDNPSHIAIVEDEETGQIERVALPLRLTNRDVVRRIPVDAHLGAVEL